MLTLVQAQQIIEGALRNGRQLSLRPLTVVVLDARAAVLAVASEDGSGTGRFAIARGKANGALAVGSGSRTMAKRAQGQPSLVACFAEVIEGGLVPAAGGVLVLGEGGQILGAVGISGDLSDADEAAALAGVADAGFAADPGSDA